MRMVIPALSLLVVIAQQAPPAPPLTPVPSTKLQTRWAAQVTPDRVLPEYPRPQLARANWTNLNGMWTYTLTTATAPRPTEFPGQILVPFPVESQLSRAGVWVAPDQRLWYRRTFPVPAGSIIFLAPNDLHGWKNVGTTNASYAIITWKTAKTGK